jgi:hypothetical protein
LVKQIIEAFDVQEQKDKQEKLDKQALKEQKS